MSFFKILNSFTQGFKQAEQGLSRLTYLFESKIKRLQRKLFLSMFNMVFIMLSFLFLTLGLILLFSRYFSLEYVLIGAGLFFLYIAVMFRLMK